jgi:hypothetical protein
MKSIVILACLYDDWQSAAELFRTLGEELVRAQRSAELVLVDDGSLEPRPSGFLAGVAGFSRIEIVTLNRNLGNQRAQAVGVIIMDSDGEDRPSDALQLIEAFEVQKAPRIVFAARTKRSEAFVFRAFYHVYRVLHSVLTGYRIRFGNFSVVPRALLGRLVVDPNLWLHFAATVVSSRIPYTSVPTQRGRRLHGHSKLNLTSLVIHGIAAISCYNEIVGVRLVFCSLGLGAVLTALIIAVIAIRLATPWAIPGWASFVVGLLLVLLVQVLLMVVAFAAIAISNRKAQFFLPVQQYKFLIRQIESVPCEP